MAVAHGVLALPASMLDGVFAFGDQSPILGGEVPCVFQGESPKASETHFPTASVKRVAKDPLTAAILALDQSQAVAILMLARRRGFDEEGC
jgi:hypothetical protein